MSTHYRFCAAVLTSVALLSLAPEIRAADAPLLLDDFSKPDHTHTGAARLLFDDSTAGGKSKATQACEDGVLTVRGQLAPGRGMPAFISVPLLVNPDGQPQDLSAYTGVRLRVRIFKGNLSVQVSSAEIENFDYHTSAPVARDPDGFQEVRIPFSELHRAWSEQIPLNLQTVTSVNFVSVGMAPGEFAYAVDEVGFY